MTAKDTVFGYEDYLEALKGTGLSGPDCVEEFDDITCHQLLPQALATWPIAYKEGQDYEHKIMIGLAVDEGNKSFKAGKNAGIKEVVEVVNNLPSFGGGGGYNFAGIGKEWEDKKREWGL